MVEINAIILAGGVGARLWPLSRSLAPKQMQKIGSRGTLLQDTITRVHNALSLEDTVFVTSADLVHEIKRQALECVGPEAEAFTYVGEPFRRNTAPAILLAAFIVSRRDPDALMLVMPSDHIIQDQNAFSKAVEKSLGAAKDGYLVTYGIVPTRADTGYGYIKINAPLGEIYTVHSFKEKPPLKQAQEYLEDGTHFWNSGIFLFSAKDLLSEGRTYVPELVAHLAGVDLNGFTNLVDIYRKIESVSIDHGIMEKTDKAAVVPVSMGWSDVGSWDSLYDIIDKDDSGDVISGDVIKLNTQGNLILGSDRRLICAADMDDMIVVDTSDALLICPREHSQSVRDLVKIMQDQNREQIIQHPQVYRPWGCYVVIFESDAYKVKRITVDPGEKLSLQLHNHRNENWIVVRGAALVTKGDSQHHLRVGESIHIPELTLHRLENPGEEILEIIEVQDGSYLGEDDIVRIDDKYGRVK